jgi:hypothetical protein
MRCPKCGVYNNQINKFCSNCGESLNVSRADNKSNLQPSVNQKGPVRGMRPLFSNSEETSIPPANSQSDNWSSSSSNSDDIQRFRPIRQEVSQNHVLENGERWERKSTPESSPQLRSNQNKIPRAIKCPSCGAENEFDSGFCSNCGNSMQGLASRPKKSDTKICPNCGIENPAHVNFCNNCGNSFLNNKKSNIKEKLSFSIDEPVEVLNSLTLWMVLSLIGSILAVISFFLPMQVMKFSNPMAWLGGGPEQISFTSSGWQLMTLSSPSVKGLGGLGETAENLYNELDFGSLMMDTGDPEITFAIVLARVLLFLLFISSIAAVVLTILAYKKDDVWLSKVMMILSLSGIVLLIIVFFVTKASFSTGSSDLDLILNSTIKLSNGTGLWGMLLGFIGFGIGSFIRKGQKGENNVL